MQNQSYMPYLYRWIDERNRAWLGQENLNSKAIHLNGAQDKEIQIARQTQLTCQSRGLRPSKRESCIIRHSENDCYSYVLVSALIHTRSTYSIGKKIVEEGVEEHVCFQLTRTNQNWQINHICFDENVLPEEIHNVQLSARYNRSKAVEYADKFWNTHNPAYRHFGEDDCTNFVSQALHAGGIAMDFAKARGKGWRYRGSKENWSFSWAVAHSLVLYLRTNKASKGPRAEERSQAKGLELGDVICYDWQGNGRWDHNAIVTQIDPNGEPLVSAHSIDSHHRYWRYTDSYAYAEGKTKYAFFHIIN